MFTKVHVLIVGGGAAGFFAAALLSEWRPDLDICIIEQSGEYLQKVRISGGGRCNVTHNCTDPELLVKHYPRGEKALLGPFHRFGPADVMDWFHEHGVPLKTEGDGRVFPQSNSSESIVKCLMQTTRTQGVRLVNRTALKEIRFNGEEWECQTNQQKYIAKQVIICSGANQGIWKMIHQLGHHIIEPCPSLFTFNTNDALIRGLAGISLSEVQLGIKDTDLVARGPMLITHSGLSGPAILRLSAWGARILANRNYTFELIINFSGKEPKELFIDLKAFKEQNREKKVSTLGPAGIPRRLWERLSESFSLLPGCRWKHVQPNELEEMSKILTRFSLHIHGKSTFKEEFVTAGGVDLNEIHFKTMESRKFPGLYFAGEVMDVDAITGGFNFQHAWTSAWHAAKAIQESI